MPEGLNLNHACQQTFALLCVCTADTWWNNCYGLKKKRIHKHSKNIGFRLKLVVFGSKE